jgi:NMD protein affecting ribosome stability and mRNA decay
MGEAESWRVMVARRRRERLSAERWGEDARVVWTGLADWRAAHPKATFDEIEAALDERLNQVRARVLADLALASTAADVQAASRGERPRCAACGTVLQARGTSDRTLLTQGGAEVRLERSYATCPRCGDGSFPPGR